MSKVELKGLSTEQRNPASMELDGMTPLEIATVINNEDKKVALAVEKELPTIAAASESIAARFKQGGRIIYIGAGTSGRLGTLDAIELTPTYNVSPSRAFGIMAGGNDAMYCAVEGAEDNYDMAVDDLKKVGLGPQDTVIAVAASGRTPYGIGALEYARQVGALCVSVTCNKGSRMDALADYGIAPVVGPEVVTGSTRMKSGTAQKMVLNMLSTGVMVQCGKVYQNLMVNVQATNEKLIARSVGIICQITGQSEADAAALFAKADNVVSTAIVMQQAGKSKDEALQLLAQHDNNVRRAIAAGQDGGTR